MVEEISGSTCNRPANVRRDFFDALNPRQVLGHVPHAGVWARIKLLSSAVTAMNPPHSASSV